MQKGNGNDGERLKLSLVPNQKAALMACGEEYLRATFRKACHKGVRNMRGREDKEKDETYEKAVVGHLSDLVTDLFARGVAMGPDTSVLFQEMKKTWVASKPLDAAAAQIKSPPKATAEHIATAISGKLADHLLDHWATTLTGLPWEQLMQKLCAEAHEATLAAKITGSQEDVRAGVQAHKNAFVATFGDKALTEAGKRLLVQSILRCLDKDVAPYVPGTERLAKVVDRAGTELAAAICEAVEKAERVTKRKPAAPTEVTDGASFKGSCFNCGKTGHKRDECVEQAKVPEKGDKKTSGSSRTKALSGNKREGMRCATCGAENEHYTRACTEQVCLSCGEKGHAKIDCQKSGEKKEENKPSTSKYPSVVETGMVPGAAVLKVEAKIDGKTAKIGLDTYAGCGMVLESLVAGRRDEWKPTRVVLEGVADELVKPKGEVIMTVQIGGGQPFTQSALVVTHLPGDVQALVSFDSLQKVGLRVSEDEVRVGGRRVVLAGGVVPREGRVSAAASVQKCEESQKELTEGDRWPNAEAEKQVGRKLEAVPKQNAAKASAQVVQGESKQLKAVEKHVEADEWAARSRRKEWRKELRGKEARFGKEQLTFVQLEGRGRVQDVFEGPNGEPVFSTTLGALEEPQQEKRKEEKSSEAKKTAKKSKAVKPKKKESQGARKTSRAEARQREFEAVAQELEEMAIEREWAEQLEIAERARQVAASTEMHVLAEVPQQEAAAGMGKVMGQRAIRVSEYAASGPRKGTGSKEAAATMSKEAAATTVRAVEIIERHAKAGEWVRVDARELLGTEQEVETIDPDEFCVPEPPKPGDMDEFMTQVQKLADESKFTEPGSKESYKAIMQKHFGAYCLRLEQFVPGRLDVPKLKLVARPGPPIRDARRSLNPEDEEWLRKQTLLFDEMGLWEVPSPEMMAKLFVSNPVVVKTTDRDTGELKRRVTFDFWGPNSRINPGPQRVPLHHELADRARHAALWDKDDGFSGYYQYPLDEDSKYLTGVYTPLGVRVFNCMPMGINVAPTVWNTAMAEKFKELPLDRLFLFMDDFMRWTNSAPGKTRSEVEKEHLEHLDAFLTKVEEAALKLKLPKAQHGREEIEAIGMMYGGGKTWKTDWTTQVVRDYPLPRGGKQMERFLALGNYYAQFVDNYAGRVTRLRVLARKKRWSRGDFADGTQEREDFDAIRDALSERMKLEMPDWTREFIVKSDWSQEAMGAALLQAGDDGKLRPLAFISRKCTPAEAVVGAPDGEMLALVNAIKRFERFVLGRKFTAYVDQGSLGWLKDKSLSSVNNRRLQASFAYLRQFQFDLLYRKSKEMQDVDALSRIGQSEEVACCVEVHGGVSPIAVMAAVAKMGTSVAPGVAKEDPGPGVAQVELEEVWRFETELRSATELQKTDDEVMAIRQIRNGKKLADIEMVPAARAVMQEYLARDKTCEEFVEGEDGRLYHLDNRKGRIVRQLYVPLVMRGRLVVTKHGAGGHRAAEETLEKLKKSYYWASMRRDVVAWIGSCGCQKKKGERKKRVGELQSMKVMRPGQKVVFDIFGPLPVSLKGNVYLLVMVDVGTREVMLKALPTKEAKGIARALLKRVYLRGMCPEIFQSDLAKEFVADVMKELTELLGAEFRHSSPYHPQTNTHVERYNKTIATQLSLMLKREDQRDWDEYLRHIEYAQLVGAQRVLGRVSPLFLKGGWEALDPSDAAMDPVAMQTRSKELGEWMEDLQRARQLAMESQELEIAREARTSGKQLKKRDVDVGDTVWVMFPNVGKGKSRKLAFRMHGPYVLKEWLHGGHRVAMLGHEAEPNDEIMAHVDRMVRKKDVPQRLKDQWKPIKLKLADQQQRKRKGEAKKQAKEAEQAWGRVDEEVAKDLRKELDDVEMDMDHIVAKSFVMEDEREGWQYRVRFVGYGPKDDEWYWEEDLKKTAPKEVQEFNRTCIGGMEKKTKKRAKEGEKKGQKKQGRRSGKVTGAAILRANVG